MVALILAAYTFILAFIMGDKIAAIKKKEEAKVQIEEATDEDFVIKEDKSVRYVDTRTSTVEIEKIEGVKAFVKPLKQYSQN